MLTTAWLTQLVKGQSAVQKIKGLSPRPQTPDRTNTQGLNKNNRGECAAFAIISPNGYTFKSSQIRAINCRPRLLLHHQCYMVSMGC